MKQTKIVRHNQSNKELNPFCKHVVLVKEGDGLRCVDCLEYFYNPLNLKVELDIREKNHNTIKKGGKTKQTK